MHIGLIDVDFHNFPNIPLMKISGYHKKRGATVEFATDQEFYNKVYVSKIFTESKEPDYSKINTFEWSFGGSGQK